MTDLLTFEGLALLALLTGYVAGTRDERARWMGKKK